MEDGKKDEGAEKKMMYVQPALISLDKVEGAKGNGDCVGGSVAAVTCGVGSIADSCGTGNSGGA